MSYYDDWKNGTLEANVLDSMVIIDGNTEIDITNDVSIDDFVIGSGEENLFNTFSQETVTFSLNNSGHKYDGYDFKKKYIRFTVKTASENGSNYTTSYRNFYIDKAEFVDEHIQLECLLFNMDQARVTLNGLFPNTTDFNTLSNCMYNIAADMQNERDMGFSFGTWTNSHESLAYKVLDENYMADVYNNIQTNGELIKQYCKILGGYATIKRGITYPSLYIEHFPTTTLTNEIDSYVYGGTFDEVDNTSYNTGDTLDGNTDTKDGGAFDVDYIVIDDNVLSEVQVGSLYNPQRVKATVPNWTATADGYDSNEGDIIVPSTPADSSIIDITDADVLKTALDRQGTHYNDILSNTHDEVCFPSYNFEATMLNNLKLELGQVVAIQTGVAPTRFSYIEKINTDLFGATTISNSRGE